MNDSIPHDSVTPARAAMNGKPVFTVPAKTVLNLHSGFAHKLLCDGPTFSTGTACAYSCSFCYVPAAMRKQAAWLQSHGVPFGVPPSGGPALAHEDLVIRRENAPEILRRQLTDAKGRPKYNDPTDRRVIYASPLVDVAANMELVGETVECCKIILDLTHWDIRLLSKSNLLPKVAVGLEACGAGMSGRTNKSHMGRVIYGVSTGTLDDGLARAFEQGCPLVSKRLQSLHWLQDNGFRTFGMICPSLVQRDYDQFARDMFTAIRAEKCEHVWAEVLNVRGDSALRTIAALRAAGYSHEASVLSSCFGPSSSDPKANNCWESYARATFEAHAAVYSQLSTKLRFLQYVTNATRPYWESQIERGAILL